MAGGLVQKNPVNDASAKTVDARSNFNLSYGLAGTYSFGRIAPHFVMEGVPDDKGISLRSAHDIRSYTLKAPLMQDVKINKDYFIVYNDALLPKSWDLIYTNPRDGEDLVSPSALEGVDVSKVNTTINPEYFYLLLQNFASGLSGQTSGAASISAYRSNLTYFLRCLIACESIFSAGALPAHLQYGFHKAVTATLGYVDVSGDNVDLDDLSFDEFFNGCMDWLKNYIESFNVYFDPDQPSFEVNLTGEQNDYSITLEEFLDMARDDLSFYIVNPIYVQDYVEETDPDLPSFTFLGTPYISGGKLINYARCAAYNIVCSHYYTNDKVDYIYSAQLYRDQLGDLYKTCKYQDTVAYVSHPTFQLNGIDHEYDWLSGYCLTDLLSNWFGYIPNSEATDKAFHATLNYLRMIFGLNRSLRFVDYFVGSKTHPLAVGDVYIDVNSSKVSAIDVTRNIQRQRFFNAVNRTGRKVSEYIKGIFGQSVRPDYHDPFFVARTSDQVFNSEVENTGAAQVASDATNTITSTMRSNAERFAFEISEIDKPCIILGLTSFEIPRYYSAHTDRQNFHVDRFDMFNPFMQTIGDQEVYTEELSPLYGQYDTFGYQLRHMEYKQRVNSAFGGVVLPSTDLDLWFFLADRGLASSLTSHMNPDYIRSRPTEFDPFYASLTGYSLGTRFHFIVKEFNDVEASRPMIYAPSIL